MHEQVVPSSFDIGYRGLVFGDFHVYIHILVFFFSCTAPPGAINHTNGDVTARLVSLDSVNVTWRIPQITMLTSPATPRHSVL